MAFSQKDWQSAIKLLGELPAAPPWNSDTPAAPLASYVSQSNRLLQRLPVARTIGITTMSPAAWNKLLKKQAIKTPGGIKKLPTSNQAARKKRVESYGAKAITDDPMADL